MTPRRLAIVRLTDDQARNAAGQAVERRANEIFDVFLLLLEAHNDLTATAAELADFRETSIAAIESQVAALRADVRRCGR